MKNTKSSKLSIPIVTLPAAIVSVKEGVFSAERSEKKSRRDCTTRLEKSCLAGNEAQPTIGSSLSVTTEIKEAHCRINQRSGLVK